ncbi:MAG: hypothetical protein KBS44_00485, partial [Clostridiales bacterium]|nr:hypothetical protein [Candidatus Coliplasma equi]
IPVVVKYRSWICGFVGSGRGAGVRNRCFGVKVRVLFPAPNKKESAKPTFFFFASDGNKKIALLSRSDF